MIVALKRALRKKIRKTHTHTHTRRVGTMIKCCRSKLFRKQLNSAREMAPRVETLAINPGGLNSIPGCHMVEEEN